MYSEADGLSQAISVSELNQHLKMVVEETFPLLWVAGEVTDLARPRSGHIYFTLKDDDSQIRGVIWRNVAMRLGFELENGQSILVFGGLEIYTVRGTYQIVVRKAQPQGIGALQLAYEQLKRKLDTEGLFSAERKRPLPIHPRRVGVITSPSGAAVHDFLVAADNRMIGAEIFVIPAQVQGGGATETIVRGLKAAAMIRPALDVVVVTRGGGSLEDLWCFNEEPVVRAIADCPIPTVSAIGHEVDVTLCDLAADVRALTPTDAATRVFSDRSGVTQRVAELARRLERAMQLGLERRRYQLDALANRPVLTNPLENIHHRSQLVDELDARARIAIDRKIESGQTRLATLAASLSALSPLATLARGYSVTTNDDDQAISRASELSIGQQVTTRLAEGSFSSSVEQIHKGDS